MAFAKRLGSESGYSLVEVMASIVILTVAIIPMVAMFDSGLKAASNSGNYDTARAFANKKMEQAKSLPYAGVRDSFPRSGDSTPTTGTPATINGTTETGVPEGFSYKVSKQYTRAVQDVLAADRMKMTTGGSTDTGLIEVTITVTWGGGKFYTMVGVVGKDTP